MCKVYFRFLRPVGLSSLRGNRTFTTYASTANSCTLKSLVLLPIRKCPIHSIEEHQAQHVTPTHTDHNPMPSAKLLAVGTQLEQAPSLRMPLDRALGHKIYWVLLD